jgi:hypothetical protein
MFSSKEYPTLAGLENVPSLDKTISALLKTCKLLWTKHKFCGTCEKIGDSKYAFKTQSFILFFSRYKNEFTF